MAPTLTLLLVDRDPPALQELAAWARSLSTSGAVVPCRSAADALDMIGRSPDRVGLVVCDLQDPVMGGAGVMRALARLAYRGRVAVLTPTDPRVLDEALRLAIEGRLDLVGALPSPGGSPVDQGPAWPATSTAGLPHRALLAGAVVNRYQPRVDCQDGRLVGVEVLARWVDGSGRAFGPGQFLPRLGEAALLHVLTDVVLQQALWDAAGWRARGLALPLSVNVSLADLGDPAFPERLKHRLLAHDTAPEQVTLELTDAHSVCPGPPDPAVIAELRALGVPLWLDDFGMGRASFALLDAVPCDGLKVDECFVHGAAQDPQLAAMFSASCAVARSRGLALVAEGVEDAADWDLVRRVPGALAQGYHFAPPLPAGAVVDWAGAQ